MRRFIDDDCLMIAQHNPYNASHSVHNKHIGDRFFIHDNQDDGRSLRSVPTSQRRAFRLPINDDGRFRVPSFIRSFNHSIPTRTFLLKNVLSKNIPRTFQRFFGVSPRPCDEHSEVPRLLHRQLTTNSFRHSLIPFNVGSLALLPHQLQHRMISFLSDE